MPGVFISFAIKIVREINQMGADLARTTAMVEERTSRSSPCSARWSIRRTTL